MLPRDIDQHPGEIMSYLHKNQHKVMSAAWLTKSVGQNEIYLPINASFIPTSTVGMYGAVIPSK